MAGAWGRCGTSLARRVGAAVQTSLPESSSLRSDTALWFCRDKSMASRGPAGRRVRLRTPFPMALPRAEGRLCAPGRETRGWRMGVAVCVCVCWSTKERGGGVTLGPRPHAASAANTSFTPQRTPAYHAARRPTSNSKPVVPPARLAQESLCARSPSAALSGGPLRLAAGPVTLQTTSRALESPRCTGGGGVVVDGSHRPPRSADANNSRRPLRV